MSRKNDRKHALCLVFAREFNENDIEYYKNHFAVEALDAPVKEGEFVDRVVRGICENKEQIDALISASCTASWSFSRLSKVDLSIMRLATYEMLFEEDIAPSVSINEAVDIAKEFSTEEAGKFVNGVLGDILSKINNAGTGAKNAD
ncbi:MAG: transcription antitermination factor NusB [Defluviitaleaceae bacterium]|nr:transcription antitermination factor NusB [Defluviitaleaceae bacterium]